MKPPIRALKRLRYAFWCAALLAAGYLVLRFETVTLPSEACSPLLSISPGARLWIDVFARAPIEGDIVLFRAADLDDPEQPGALLLGRVEAPPLDLPTDVAQELAGGALWIVGDHPSCPVRDSRLLGPIPRAALEGRLVFTW